MTTELLDDITALPLCCKANIAYGGKAIIRFDLRGHHPFQLIHRRIETLRAWAHRAVRPAGDYRLTLKAADPPGRGDGEIPVKGICRARLRSGRCRRGQFRETIARAGILRLMRAGGQH